MGDTLKTKEQLARIVELFVSGELVKTAALVVIPQDANAPSAKWSMANRILQAINGTGDARGIKQWNNVGRSVRAGSKAFCILGPSMVKSKEDPERMILVGFHCIPVFRVEDTQGDALPQLASVEKPLLSEVADKWGINVRYTPFSDKYYGAYSPTKGEIMLCTHEQEVFFHELSHAAHARVMKESGRALKGGQDDKQEIVAEMSACVLARVYGVKAHEDKICDYVKGYAKGKDLGRTLMGLLSEIQKVTELIIKTSEEIKAAVQIAA